MRKIEHFFYVKLQLRVIYVSKGIILLAKTPWLLFVIWRVDFVFNALATGQITLSKGILYNIENSPFSYFNGLFFHSLFMLIGLWFTTLGTADRGKRFEIQREIKKRKGQNSNKDNTH
jgi:hypothetical protein